MTASLNNAQVNLQYIKELAYDDFKKALSGNTTCNHDKKSLVFEQDLIPYIELSISQTQLKGWNVVSFHYLDNINPSTNYVVFIIRKNPKSWQNTINYITKNTQSHYKIIVISNDKYTIGMNMLERANLRTKIPICTLPITLIPIDNDLLSMEYLNAFKENRIEHNTDYLFDAAESIILLQQLYGIIPVIQGIGEQAQIVAKEVIDGKKLILHTDSSIARMIIIDRACDYITPLLTQITFTGALDEQIGIESNKVRINGKIIKVNSDDQAYVLIRDKRLDDIIDLLKPEMSKYTNYYKMAKESKLKGDIKELNEAISSIKELNKVYKETSLTNLYNLLQMLIIPNDIIDIEQQLLLGQIKDDAFMKMWLELLKKKMEVMVLIKCICLYCIISDGITVDLCKQFERYIIQYYGTNYVFVFDNLFTAGILFPKGYDGRWKKLHSTFNLIADDYQDISYTYNGYAPLSCRLVEYALSVKLDKFRVQKKKDVMYKGWVDKDINNKVNLVDDPFYVVQETNLIKDNVVLVYFIGGITYAEIAALRYISKMNKDKHILIATTCIINGNKMVQSFLKR